MKITFEICEFCKREWETDGIGSCPTCCDMARKEWIENALGKMKEPTMACVDCNYSVFPTTTDEQFQCLLIKRITTLKEEIENIHIKIDGIEDRIDNRIDALREREEKREEADMERDKKINLIDNRHDRLYTVEGQTKSMERKIDDLRDRISALETYRYEHFNRLNEIERAHNKWAETSETLQHRQTESEINIANLAVTLRVLFPENKQ